MRRMLACVACGFSFVAIGLDASGQNLLHTARPWIGFDSHETTSQVAGSYRLVQTPDGRSDATEVYVQKNTERPHPIFTNQRYVEFLIGHRGEQALINYYVSSKAFEVYAASLASGGHWRVDEKALQAFSRNSGADPSLIIVAAGEALSPDDREILLSINLVYISVSTPEEADQKFKTFKKWWYAVSTSTGQVVHEYRMAAVPPDWASEYQKTSGRGFATGRGPVVGFPALRSPAL